MTPPRGVICPRCNRVFRSELGLLVHRTAAKH